MTPLSSWIERNADCTPDKAALVFKGRTLTYGAFADRVRQAALALSGELGLRRGDRIAYLGANAPEMLVLLFAAARLGLILVPLNWRLAAPEHAFMLADAEASILFVERAFLVSAREAAPPGCRLVGTDFGDEEVPSLDALCAVAGAPAPAHGTLGDPLLLVYTAGTTGRPKGAVLSQEALFWNAVNAAHAFDLTGRDRVLTVLPMFHVGGLNIQTTPALHAGATVILHDRFEPGATLRAIAEDKPTLTVLVPTTMQAVIEHPDWASTDLSSLKALATGSTDVPLPLIAAFHARSVPVQQIYGSTETCPTAIVLKREDAMTHAGSIGKPALHAEARIMAPDGTDAPPGTPGEIAVRGRNVMTGYWRDAAATATALRDGWFLTGDVGHKDRDGFFWFTDRLRNVIISGGENIYPAEIERVLRAIPEIAEAAVVGRSDPRWGEVPVAVVVPRENAALGKEDVLSRFEGELARFKHPKDVIFVDALPRNAMGKVQGFELKRLVDAPAA